MRMLLALLLASPLMGQLSGPPPAIIKGNPPGGLGGPCVSSQLIGYLNANGNIITCPSGTSVWTVLSGGGGGALPSGSEDSIQTYATSSSFGNSGFASADGVWAIGNNALFSDLAVFEYSQTVSDPTPFAGILSNQFVLRYSGASPVSQINSLNFYSFNDGAGDADVLSGQYGQVTNAGAGSVTDAFGASYYIENAGAGSITNAYGLYVYAPGASGITNVWGMKIEDQPGHSIELGTGLFESSGTMKFTGLPTSCSGQPANSVAAIAGVLTLCP